jgi:hypothetical protein
LTNFSEDKKMSNWKLLVPCICGVLLLTQVGQAQNLVQNPGFENTTADPNLVCANWTRTTANVSGVTTMSRLAGGGQSGSASLHFAAGTDVGLNSTSNGAWQNVGPLVIGAKYQIHGKWRGKMALGTVSAAVGSVEVYYGFGSSATARASSERLVYSKREQYGSTNRHNVDPNSTWDWQDISASPTMGGDNTDTVIATNTYMTVRFNMSTTTQQGDEYLDVDNVTVQGCQAEFGSADLNSDCVVNFRDMATVTNNWLTCGVAPSSLCW